MSQAHDINTTHDISAASETAINEQATMKKVMRRLIPFILLCYVVSYLDRINVGFAALTMNKDLGLTPSQFGLGAGLFFIGYFFFEIPSNLALHRFGARMWISRIMISWGVISMLTAFVVGPKSFALARFFLGMAEAGFTPGIYLYFTKWFPGEWRGKATAFFLVGIPVANIIGSPISGALMEMHGLWGYKGWQVLLLLEALPAVVLGTMCLFLLPDRPSKASWLTPAEKQWLEAKLDTEQNVLAARHGNKLRDAFTNWRVFVLAGANFCGILGSLSIGLWLPQIIKEFGLPSHQVGLVAAVPYIVGAIAMTLWARLASKSDKSLFFVAGAITTAAVSVAISAFLNDPLLKMLAITVAVASILSFQATFWAIPSRFLTGRAAAGGLALIVSIGNLGGFVGPSIIGFIREATKGFTYPLIFVASALLLGAVITLALGDPTKSKQ
ncbi:MFS transporter [Collimonas pratensis]|uniref:Major Facilitator Superfamily protein n=1 Tax=Collimonas pratensis TaxID=279113 RepID=A0A127PYH4_9BURK|nr:MFS transporter [Collimonas pratensis]AMP02843.1 major Facilitator Superfamily protein [Collimonas pratensis]